MAIEGKAAHDIAAAVIQQAMRDLRDRKIYIKARLAAGQFLFTRTDPIVRLWFGLVDVPLDMRRDRHPIHAAVFDGLRAEYLEMKRRGQVPPGRRRGRPLDWGGRMAVEE